MARSLSGLVAAVLLVLLTAVSATLLYIWVTYSTSAAQSRRGEDLAGLKIDAVEAGSGYILLYVHCVSSNCIVDTVYVEAANHVEKVALQPPLRLSRGEVATIPIPFLALSRIEGSTKAKIILDGPGIHAQVITRISAKTPLPSLIGLLAARDVSCSTGDLNVNKNLVHWLYVDLVTGRYMFRYIQDASTKDAEGKAKVIASSNLLDLSKMSREERYQLGPVVVFLNPYRAASAYTVTIVDIHGNRHVYRLASLTRNPDRVVFDALVLWEDLWWPGTTASLDNYVDHVIRVTMFTNATLRVEVMHASGCYLHFFLYSTSGLPGFDEVPGILEYYMSHNHTVTPDMGVIYVKSHGAYVPPLGDEDIWDPVRGEWLREWPVVLLIKRG